MNNLEELKQLVDKIVKYTTEWSITEIEWYWNIDSVRKSNYVNEEHITDKEFESAVREEILYDLVFNNGCGLLNQMENDYEYGYFDYEEQEDGTLKEIGYDKHWLEESIEVEKAIRTIIKDFQIDRLNFNGKIYHI